jgi:hypothetical protein
MDENPYSAPLEVGYQIDGEPLRPFRVFGLTVIEWLVVVGIVLVITALLLPEVRSGPHRRRTPAIPQSPGAP